MFLLPEDVLDIIRQDTKTELLKTEKCDVNCVAILRFRNE